MAVQAVLALPELLEQILINIDMDTLLFAQRVNRTFDATIQSSRTLQETLFFRLKPASTRIGPLVMNPWLTKPRWFYSAPRTDTEGWRLSLNPFTLAAESSARKMHLSSHAGTMRCGILQGMRAHHRPWTPTTEVWLAERPAKGPRYDIDSRGETLGEFGDKTLEEERREYFGFLGFDSEETVWHANDDSWRIQD
ncbi:hypothetical protein B0A48_03774 [Cryoendolithus antarcticus]|uniref:F-box domain-containing protein n=1 Tax=Cryoendolithus antarcticus TaxID=1507870 RepID=A0A1V8TGG8_9PEZI|nr:hypothetical protein B0A48_03774 [Cryoendolithus antarcticus]